MIPKKFSFILTAIIIFILSTVSFAQADGPSADDGTTTGTSFGETLDFSGFNLGNIMSGHGSSDDTGMTDDGEDDTEGGDEETGDDEGDGAGNEDPNDDGGDANDNGDGDDTDGDGPEADTSEAKEHPVARAIADYFDVPYEDVFDLHEAGNGFGTITKAYYFTNLLSDAELMTPPESPEALLEAAHGSGWGNILKDYGIHPGSIGNGQGHRPDSEATTADASGSKHHTPPGQAKKNQAAMDGVDAGTSDLVGQGNGAGMGRANGQGHNGAAGNGNGTNDHSNGNGNGGGKSNGHGKGHNK